MCDHHNPYGGHDDEHGRDAALPSPAGESLIFEGNAFVERVLPEAIIRRLNPDEQEYRRPFLDPARRQLTLTWPASRDVVQIVTGYGALLASSDIPKLLIRAEPGVLITGASLEFCRGWANQTEVTVAGRHFIQ